MESRTLGNSSLRVPVLCLGGNIFGHFCNELETKQIIDFAFEQGINFIDTANVYSEGISERYIGTALRGRRDKFIIATKAGLRSDQKPEGVLTRGYILKSAEESLQRLQTSYLDLYQVHHFDDRVPLEETLLALSELVNKGKVRYVGCSNYSLSQLKKSISLGLNNKFLSEKFVSLQLPYNLLEQSNEQLISFCGKAGIGVLTYQSLARGLLTGKYDKGEVPANSRASESSLLRSQITSENVAVVKKLTTFASELGRSVTELSLAWILQRTEVSSAIIGVRSIDQLKVCLAATTWKLQPKEIVMVTEIVKELQS